jgi:tripartite-type tricarboxylate transporter receptor subunit TctC
MRKKQIAGTHESRIVRMKYHSLALIAVLGAACSAVAAQAADWPTRPVRIIAPSTPGGAADSIGRLVGDPLSELYRHKFYIENRPGAGGLIGAVATARAEPDGYTLVTSSVAYHVIAPAVSANPGFHPLRDATHIAFIGGSPTVFVAHPKAGIRSIKDLVDHAAKNSPFSFVSPGVGTLGHLMAEYFAQKAAIKLQHVPHKGSSEAMLDLIAGNVSFGTMSFGSAQAQIRAGNVIAIAVTGEERIPEYPDLPTLRELGFPDLVATTWYGLSGPAGVPADIVQKLNEAVRGILDRPEVRRRMQIEAILTKPMTADEFTRFMASELDKWGPVARQVVAPR